VLGAMRDKAKPRQGQAAIERNVADLWRVPLPVDFASSWQ